MEESNRQRKFSRLVQRELSDILNRHFPVSEGTMVTVSMVRSTPDLGLIKVYVSAFPDEKRNKVVEALNESQKEIRKTLAGRIRNQIKSIPEIKFYEDDSLQYAENINKILSDLDKDTSESKEEN